MDRHKNIFDKIGSLIPGYIGYAEREGRRNSDKILRENIVSKLNETEKHLYERMNDSLKLKDKETMVSIEETRKKINTFISRVKYSSYGVTAFFSDNQIKENELLKIYKIDLELEESTENLHQISYNSPISEINKVLVLCQKILNKRNSFINEYK